MLGERWSHSAPVGPWIQGPARVHCPAPRGWRGAPSLSLVSQAVGFPWGFPASAGLVTRPRSCLL